MRPVKNPYTRTTSRAQRIASIYTCDTSPSDMRNFDANDVHFGQSALS
jgi:hypothetical protein